jgi:O-acetylhomoserine/O-acetylserine sulfhydrylase-like pyridoxal-dependent enzyme
MSHHDGTNYTLYRIAKDEDDAERIAEMIYNNEIEIVKIGKKIHVSRTELIRFLIDNTIGANDSKEGLE